ncbi:MAG: M28 family peptidase [Longimicrobiales bacterium]
MNVRLLTLILALSLPTACLGGRDDAIGQDTGPEDPDAFVAADSARMMDAFRFLSSDSLQGRRTGEPGNTMAREFILAAFRDAGLLEPETGVLQAFEFTGRRDRTQVTEGANVVGFVPGTGPEAEAIVLTAHFDHLGVRNGEIYNGADDNASGTVALMSLARYVARNPLRHTAVFAALDGEEMGLRGARAFLEAGWPQEIVLNVNMDMVSRSDSLLFAAGTSHYPHLRPILETVRARPPVVLRFGHDEPGVEGVDDWTGSSDHRVFHGAGIPFVYFSVEDHPDYHRATDDFERVDPAFFVNAVRTILAGVLALDAGLGEGAGEGGAEGLD